MDIYFKEITIVLASYLLGSFSFGYYLVLFKTGEDIRLLGSYNVGAKNVGRFLGKTWFIVTLFVDVVKGAIPVIICKLIGLDLWLISIVMVAVVLGHIWPMQLRFHGGKGFATTFGGLVIFDIWLVVVLGLIGLICWRVTSNLTLSGILSVVLMPFIAFTLGHKGMTIWCILLLMILVLLAHRNNLKELLKRKQE